MARTASRRARAPCSACADRAAPATVARARGTTRSLRRMPSPKTPRRTNGSATRPTSLAAAQLDLLTGSGEPGSPTSGRSQTRQRTPAELGLGVPDADPSRELPHRTAFGRSPERGWDKKGEPSSYASDSGARDQRGPDRAGNELNGESAIPSVGGASLQKQGPRVQQLTFAVRSTPAPAKLRVRPTAELKPIEVMRLSRLLRAASLAHAALVRLESAAEAQLPAGATGSSRENEPRRRGHASGSHGRVPPRTSDMHSTDVADRDHDEPAARPP